MLTGLAALVHVIGILILLGYAQNYYYHLRKYNSASTLVPITADDL